MIEKTNILLVGGGGHCHSVIESIERTQSFNIVGISDIPARVGDSVLNYKVIVSDENIPDLNIDRLNIIITVGQIKSAELRIRLYDFIKGHNLTLPVIIDPDSIISKRSTIGEGTVVLRKSFINSGVVIGHNCIINTGAIIEHDSVIGNHVHISTGVIINGDCKIGDRCFIGSGTVISNGISVCPGTIIGAGSVVLKNIIEPGTYLGNIARKVL